MFEIPNGKWTGYRLYHLPLTIYLQNSKAKVCTDTMGTYFEYEGDIVDAALLIMNDIARHEYFTNPAFIKEFYGIFVLTGSLSEGFNLEIDVSGSILREDEISPAAQQMVLELQRLIKLRTFW